MAFATRLSNLVIMSVDHTPAELPPGLLAEYLESSATQLRVLAELADRLAVAANDTEALDGLRRETHKIRGSAGSYGFWEASRLAAGMEETAKDWVARPTTSTWTAARSPSGSWCSWPNRCSSSLPIRERVPRDRLRHLRPVPPPPPLPGRRTRQR